MTFTGKLTEWPSFWDAFSAMIHRNDRVSKIDKFKYLVAALTGDAKEILTGFNITESQYEPAVKLLKERFDDREFIIHRHYANLTDLRRCMNVLQSCEKHQIF